MKNHSESVFLPFRRNFEIFGVEVSIGCFSSQIRNNNGKIMERTKFTVKSIIAISGKHDLVEDVEIACLIMEALLREFSYGFEASHVDPC